jgi:hypothetical protein
MKQRAHAWVALRALKLIDDSQQAPKLIELLSYYISDVWNGAWLPDTLIVDMRYGHIFKMDSSSEWLAHDISHEDWFRVPYTELNKKLVGKRLCLKYAKDSEELEKPYRSHPRVGGHLPNRVIAISQSISDMLKMSDFPIAFYARDEKPESYSNQLTAQKVSDLSLSPIFSARQIALLFFVLSHYIADAHMPLHCDLRDYGGKRGKLKRRLPAGLHPTIEELWESYFPTKEDLVLHQYLRTSVKDVLSSLPSESLIEMDTNSEYQPNSKISSTVSDEWVEMVHIARTSYAVSRKWIDKPYADVSELTNSPAKLDEFKHVTNCIFHDAVESVARLWIKAWRRFVE